MIYKHIKNLLFMIRIPKNLILISLILIMVIPLNAVSEGNCQINEDVSVDDGFILLENDKDTIETVTDMNETRNSNLTGNNESVNSKRQENNLSFYNTFDMLALHSALMFAVTIVGIPIAIYILIMYAINWLFDFGFKKLFLEDIQ